MFFSEDLPMILLNRLTEKNVCVSSYLYFETFPCKVIISVKLESGKNNISCNVKQ